MLVESLRQSPNKTGFQAQQQWHSHRWKWQRLVDSWGQSSANTIGGAELQGNDRMEGLQTLRHNKSMPQWTKTSTQWCRLLVCTRKRSLGLLASVDVAKTQAKYMQWQWVHSGGTWKSLQGQQQSEQCKQWWCKADCWILCNLSAEEACWNPWWPVTTSWMGSMMRQNGDYESGWLTIQIKQQARQVLG